MGRSHYLARFGLEEVGAVGGSLRFVPALEADVSAADVVFRFPFCAAAFFCSSCSPTSFSTSATCNKYFVR